MPLERLEVHETSYPSTKWPQAVWFLLLSFSGSHLPIPMDRLSAVMTSHQSTFLRYYLPTFFLPLSFPSTMPSTLVFLICLRLAPRHSYIYKRSESAVRLHGLWLVVRGFSGEESGGWVWGTGSVTAVSSHFSLFPFRVLSCVLQDWAHPTFDGNFCIHL